LHLQLDGHSLSNAGLHKYLQELKNMEDEDEAKAQTLRTIDVHTGQDVLLGRGRPFQVHTGNKILAIFIETNLKRHSQCNNTEKSFICKGILQIIKESNGRFLKCRPNEDDWEEVGCIPAFRNRTRRNASKQPVW
jgi:hypothetical protein